MATKTEKKVVFASDTVGVHVLLNKEATDKDQFGNEHYLTESKVLLPGQYVSVDVLPPYVLESVKSGKVPALKIMDESRAEETAKRAEEIRSVSQNLISTAGIVSDSEKRTDSVSAALLEEE